MHGEVTAEGCNQSNDVPLNSHSHSHSRVGRAGKKRRGTECRWTGLNWTRLILTTVILCLPACSHHHHRDHLLPYCYPPTCDRSTAPLDKTCCINSRKGGGAIRQRTVRSVAFHRTVCTVWWRRNEKEKKKQSKARQAGKQASKQSTAQHNQTRATIKHRIANKRPDFLKSRAKVACFPRGRVQQAGIFVPFSAVWGLQTSQCVVSRRGTHSHHILPFNQCLTMTLLTAANRWRCYSSERTCPTKAHLSDGEMW